VQHEFERQAESFAASRALGSADLTDRLVRALGEPGRGRVLDWACGPGLVAAALAPRAREVVALDLTGPMLRVAARRLTEARHDNVRLLQADGMRLPFADCALDAATLRLAVHHLESPRDALREIWRCLRPGGAVAVLDLLAPEDPEDDRVLCALERLRDPSHVRALRVTELLEQVRAAGFARIESETFRLERRFSEWAAIIADPVRTDALRVIMRELAGRAHGRDRPLPRGSVPGARAALRHPLP
jgi:ubiquinone/menaquinone biosynthesis C-methylase UbiE